MRELLIAALLMSAAAAALPAATATHENSDCELTSADAIPVPAGDDTYYLDTRDLPDKPAYVYQETNGAEGLQTGGTAPGFPASGNGDVDATTATASAEVPVLYSDPPEQTPCGHGSDQLIL